MLTFRALLHEMKNSNTLIGSVYTADTGLLDGELDLVGVTVLQVGFDFVVFNQAGSGGTGAVVVPLDKIIGIDY